MILPTRVTLTIEAIQRRYLMRPDLTALDVWVASPGGVGTTFLMEYMAKFVRINDPYDADGLKHWPRPPAGRALAAAPRMLFVSGNPEQIVASIARRQWVRTQSAKIGSLGGTLLKGEAQKKAFRNSVEGQIQVWRSCASEKLLFVDFDDLWDNAASIARHVGINEAAFVESFPDRKKRNTDLRTSSVDRTVRA